MQVLRKYRSIPEDHTSLGRDNQAFPLWLTTGYGHQRAILPTPLSYPVKLLLGFLPTPGNEQHVCANGLRLHGAVSTITVSLPSYESDSNSVLQEIPTSHVLPIVGQYDPG